MRVAIGRVGLQCICIAAAMLAGCAPAASTPPAQERPQAAAPRPKTITIGIARGLPDFSPFTAQSTGGSSSNIPPMVNDGLSYTDERIVAHPLKALELPSFEKGTWKTFEDGRMETTWKLRPNVFWHDGTPQSAADYLFSFEVYRDRDLPRRSNTAVLAQSGVAFPDPLTMVISWSSPHIDAGIVGPGPSGETSAGLLPKHILEDSYLTDKMGAFMNHPYWTHEYISDGPYKIVKWDLGADMELARHDQYYLGRPPFDRVFVRVIGDTNTLVTNIMAGALDIVLPPGISIDAAVELQERWRGTGNEVRADLTNRIVQFEVQFRPEQARPQAGFVEEPVRRALYQAINRVALAEYMTSGFGPLADSWYRPDEPRRSELQIPQFAYDPAAAPRLLAEVGWARGSDGALVNGRTGETFTASIWANQAANFDKLGYAVGEDWKSLGVETDVFPIPAARTGDREFEMGYTGLFVTNVNYDQFLVNRLHSSVIPSAATRYVGSNRGGHNNPRIDAMYDRLAAKIDPRDRTPIERELVGAVMGGLLMMPLYWDTLPTLKVKGVKDHKFWGASTWYFYDWDRE
jgi:peptide/nickel transport system substrate-binding protein